MNRKSGSFKNAAGVLQEMLYTFLLIGIGSFIALNFAR